MNKIFSDCAWDDYVLWTQEDRKIEKRINDLLRYIDRNGNEGIGKPEPLKHELSGYWSRRITDKERLIYRIAEGETYIIGCKGHYD